MIIMISITIISLFCIFVGRKEKYQGVYIDNKKTDLQMLKIIEEQKEETFLNHTIIENKYIQMVFQSPNGMFHSFFLDVKNGDLLNQEDIIKEEKRESFETKRNELIYLKYPKFIADVLVYGNGKTTYILNDTELILYFYDFSINPMPTDELILRIDYHQVKDELNFPVHLKEESYVENGYDYDKSKKTVALTFDDGPNGTRTTNIIKILKENKMHATFFMVGNRMASSPEILKEVLKNGNEIGSHSYHHKNLTRLKKEELLQEEEQTNLIYKSITGQDLKLLRPPYGNVNEEMKQNLNYVFVNWNLDTEDWRYRNAEHVYQSVLNKIEDGDIILMHDLYDSTVDAVVKLLPELYVRGFQVVSVSELANLKGINLEQNKVYREIK